MHADNNTPAKFYIAVRYECINYFGSWDGRDWTLYPADPSKWGFRVVTFTRITADELPESIEEIKQIIKSRPNALIFIIPAEDAPAWGLPAGGE